MRELLRRLTECLRLLFGGATKRERQLAYLVADGMLNALVQRATVRPPPMPPKDAREVN